MPSITDLATTTTVLTSVENEIPNGSDLVKKADFDAGITDIKSNIFDAKKTLEKLVYESGLNGKIKNQQQRKN